jgi:hypothetical protein
MFLKNQSFFQSSSFSNSSLFCVNSVIITAIGTAKRAHKNHQRIHQIIKDINIKTELIHKALFINKGVNILFCTTFTHHKAQTPKMDAQRVL